MAQNGVKLLSESIVIRMKVLKGLPAPRAASISAAIAVGKTAKEVDAFVEKYKDAKTEQEIYDALITEILTPLGNDWTPE
jgi:hypothetical protein